MEKNVYFRKSTELQINTASSYNVRAESLNVNGGVKLDMVDLLTVDGSGSYLSATNTNTKMARLAMNYMAHTHSYELGSDLFGTVAYPEKFGAVCLQAHLQVFLNRKSLSASQSVFLCPQFDANGDWNFRKSQL